MRVVTGMQTAVVVSLLNFPLHKGYLAGFLKGFMGLGAAVYTEVRHWGAESKSLSRDATLNLETTRCGLAATVLC